MPESTKPGLFFLDEEGGRHFVDQDNVDQAIESGLKLEPGQSASYYDDRSNLSTVSAEDYVGVVKPFQEPGARLAGQQVIRDQNDEAAIEGQFSGFTGGLKAGAAGVARGASAGLSDVLLTATGAVEAEDLRNARAARPGISMATELAGAIGPGMLAGGAGAAGAVARKTIAGQAAKLGMKATTKLGGGLKAGAAGGVIDGAIFGAGQGLSNVALSDEPLTAEAVFGQVGMGVVIGGGLGAVGGAAGEVFSKMGNKVDNIALGQNAALDLTSAEGKLLRRGVIDAASEIDDVAKSVMVNADNAAMPGSKEVFDPSVAKNYDNAMSRHFDEVEKHIDNIEAGAYKKFAKPDTTPADFNATGVVSPSAKKKAAGVADKTAVSSNFDAGRVEKFWSNVKTRSGDMIDHQNLNGADGIVAKSSFRRSMKNVVDFFGGDDPKRWGVGKNYTAAETTEIADLLEDLAKKTANLDTTAGFSNVPAYGHGGKKFIKALREAGDATPQFAKPVKPGQSYNAAPRPQNMDSARALLTQARKSGDEFRGFLKDKLGTTSAGSTKWDDAVSLTGKDLDEAKGLFSKYQDDVRRMADESGVNPGDTRKVNGVEEDTGRGLFDLLADVPVTRKVPRGALDGASDAAKAVRASEGRLRASLGSKADEPINISKVFDQEPAEAIASLKAFDDYSQGLKQIAEMVDGPGTAAAQRIQAATDKMTKQITESLGQDGGKLPELAQMALLFGVEEAAIPDMGPASDLLKLYFAYKAVKLFGAKGLTRGASKGAKGTGILGKRGLKGFIKEGVQGIVGRGATKNIFSPTGRLQNALGRQVSGVAFDFVAGGNGKLAQATGSSIKRIQDGMARSLKAVGKSAKRSSPITTRVLADVSFAGDSDRKRNKEKDAHSAFKARAEELNRSMANLPAFQQQVHDNLAGVRQVNMGVGDKLAAHTVAVAQFLHSQMPKDPGTLQQFGISKWRPTEAQMDKWARTINAAQDPAGIIERFGNGHMSREDATVLRTLYPAHFAKVQEWVMDNLPEMQEKMSYERRIQISSLMGVAADPTVSRVDVWQNSFAQEQEQKPINKMNNESTSQPTAAQQMSGARE